MSKEDKKKSALEEQYPGITEQIQQYEKAKLPACLHCGSEDTAKVRAGIVGRSIAISASTRKMKLVPNKDKDMGDYFCYACQRYFN